MIRTSTFAIAAWLALLFVPTAARADDFSVVLVPGADIGLSRYIDVRPSPSFLYLPPPAVGLSFQLGTSRVYWIGPLAGFENRDAKILSLGVSF